MNDSHFDNQLIPNENILWSGQPHEKAFHKEEARLGNFIVGFMLVWSIAYSVRMIWQHGSSYSYPFSELLVTIIGFATTILLKLLITFSRSSARYYWYAVTNKRILAEIPDEGSQTIISINLNDVRKLELKYEKSGKEKGDIGSIKVNVNTQKSKVVHLKFVNNAEAVYSILEEITQHANNAA